MVRLAVGLEGMGKKRVINSISKLLGVIRSRDPHHAEANNNYTGR